MSRGGVWLREIRLEREEWTYDASLPLGPPGAFGAVFEGRDADGNEVAIKRLFVGELDSARREVRVATELQGADLVHVLPVLDAGQDARSGDYFIVMPRATRSLAEEMIASGPMPADRAASIVMQVARGLGEIPSLVHRDMKPGNVLLHEERWKVADFGIARFLVEATAPGTLKGCLTPRYAAPEQWAGDSATRATDVYSLGCVAFELVTGKPPFSGSTDDLMRKHRSEDPPVPGNVDRRYAAVVSGMLRKAQEDRMRLDAILRELEDVAGGL